MKSEEQQPRHNKSEKTKITVTTIFVIACAIFIGYLFIVTVYETFVTGRLPSDNDAKAKTVSDWYLPPLKFVGNAYGNQQMELANEVNQTQNDSGIIHSILLTDNYQQLYAILYNYSQPLGENNITLHLDKNLTKEQQANLEAVALDTTGAGKNMTRSEAETEPGEVEVGGEEVPIDEAVDTDEQIHKEEAKTWEEEQDIGDKDKPIVIEGEGVKDTTPEEEEDELSSGEVFGNGQTESTEDPEASRNSDDDDSDPIQEEEDNGGDDDDNGDDNGGSKVFDGMGLFKQ